MRTEIVATLSPDQRRSATHAAVELLRSGELVALPTETVYGLAADASNSGAIAKIFEAKERPHFDPLIVHLHSASALGDVAAVPPEDRAVVEALIAQFWPGPLTLVLPKGPTVPDLVTAGLMTVAVRNSAHPLFNEIIQAFGKPLAAPSANRFGRISPTSAQHVSDELDGRIPLIVDGGRTHHGLESTIVKVVGNHIEILRRGPVTFEALEKFGRVAIVDSDSPVIAPGQLSSHYAPSTKFRLVENLKNFSVPTGARVGALALRIPETSDAFSATQELSRKGDLREAATNLFRLMRELDAANLDLIVAELVPEEGIGAAINDRLRRAATGS